MCVLKQIKAWLTLFAAAFCAVLFFAYNKEALSGALDGIALCVRIVIPSLFPFMILTRLIIENEHSPLLDIPFVPYARLLGIKSKKAPAAILLSFLGGFAVAAKLISSLYESGEISKRDAMVMMCCCVTSAPSFVISAVGGGIAGSLYTGAVMFISLTLASLFCGVVFGFIIKPETESQKAHLGINAAPSGFVEAVRDSVFSVCCICGYVVFFSFLMGILKDFSLSAPIKEVAAMLLESTSACKLLKEPIKCCAALSICGASIILQVRAMANKDISLAPLLASRLLHLPISLLLFKLILWLFPVYTTTAAITIFPRKTYTHIPADVTAMIFALLCMVFCAIPPRSLRKEKKKV
ncbi:MAG: hypothetical protein GXZ14_05520 [Ruminococcaceae bacterium]|nr:hypothetical protein [Oscillospiraceae bacterium]